jgi:hypothetical protein
LVRVYVYATVSSAMSRYTSGSQLPTSSHTILKPSWWIVLLTRNQTALLFLLSKSPIYPIFMFSWIMLVVDRGIRPPQTRSRHRSPLLESFYKRIPSPSARSSPQFSKGPSRLMPLIVVVHWHPHQVDGGRRYLQKSENPARLPRLSCRTLLILDQQQHHRPCSASSISSLIPRYK